MTNYFSRLTLTRQGLESRMRSMSSDSYNIHKEIWDLFPGNPDSDRDFIYSVMDDGRMIYMVSAREPISNDHWVVETKIYDPKIHSGDVYRFRLLANPTVMKTVDGKQKRHDVVMDLKQKYRKEGRSFSMNEIISISVSEWLVRRSILNGFEIDPGSLMIHSYSRNESMKGNRKITFSSVIIEGTLTVNDPIAFKDCLIKGIGTARGFGCGMLMIKHI